jgi:hypothetical protein
MTDLVHHALAYASLGIFVFPCSGKIPVVPNGVKAATTDPVQIGTWWAEWPNATIGIAAGPSRLVILDIDVKGETDGRASLRTCERLLGRLPLTRSVRTPSGGVHLYFSAPDGVELRPSAGKLGPGIDVRAGWSYVIAPPSTGYVWTLQGKPAPFTPRWAAALTPKPVQAAPVRRLPMESMADVERRAVAYIAKMEPAVAGSGGHAATFAVAVTLAKGFGLDEATTYRLMADHYNHRCKPPWSERELRHKARSASAADRVPEGYLLEDDRRVA